MWNFWANVEMGFEKWANVETKWANVEKFHIRPLKRGERGNKVGECGKVPHSTTKKGRTWKNSTFDHINWANVQIV